MFWSMGPLIVACIVLAGVLGMCSFQARGPAEGPAPTYDVPRALQADADALKIPIRLPKLPDGWQSNSGSRNGIDGRAVAALFVAATHPAPRCHRAGFGHSHELKGEVAVG